MHLRSLELTGWRNYEHARFWLQTGVNLIFGGNGQGKTSLLEAVQYLASGRSHRVSEDEALIHFESSQATLRADVVSGDRSHRVEFALRRGQRNQARVNGISQARLQDATGFVRAILFSPEDMAIVRGDPADRRRFLDDLLTQRRPAYRAVRQDYERALRQRNALLRELRREDGQDGDEALAAWSEELVNLGARIVAARLMGCAALREPIQRYYRQLMDEHGSQRNVRLMLDPATTGTVDQLDELNPDVGEVTQELRAAVAARSREERQRGTSLVGPHRDDVCIELDGLPVRTHASQGEAWAIALALRLASRELLCTDHDAPITLLDDVFAQLDDHRRRRLGALCSDWEQVLISAAVPDDVPMSGRGVKVMDGSVDDAMHERER